MALWWYSRALTRPLAGDGDLLRVVEFLDIAQGRNGCDGSDAFDGLEITRSDAVGVAKLVPALRSFWAWRSDMDKKDEIGVLEAAYGDVNVVVGCGAGCRIFVSTSV